ncbi:MAG: pyruvoyl-dependent arginine decarboxylase [Terriglobales bacterium]
MGKDMVPKRIFLTKGVGKHRERLTSFELALRDAGIASQNLVRVSSIFPPHCKLISRSQGLKYLHHGEVVFAVVAENSTKEPHRLLASSIGLAIPADRNTYGYLSEHHSFGETDFVAGEYAEELAAEMLATTLNVEFDSDRSWDEKKEIYRISNKIVRTMNITQSAVGDKRGLWTTVISAAILIFD